MDKKWIVALQGKDYPQWGGVLDDATRKGLKSLTTRIVQIPSEENGHLAVVVARAEFDDGRVFEDVGDCSPKSAKPHMAAAALRLASTRAKGRALRDALNIGETMYEELPDNEGQSAAEPEGKRNGHGLQTAKEQSAPARPNLSVAENKVSCARCGRELNEKEVSGCLQRPDWFDGKMLCLEDAKEYRIEKKRQAEEAAKPEAVAA